MAVDTSLMAHLARLTASHWTMGDDTHMSETQPEPRLWAVRWMKSEEFWHGIAIQTLGTLIAAVIVALVAIFIGVGYDPSVRYYVIYGLIVLLGFAIVAAALLATIPVIQLLNPGPKKRILYLAVLWAIIIFVATLAYMTIAPWIGAELSRLTGYAG